MSVVLAGWQRGRALARCPPALAGGRLGVLYRCGKERRGVCEVISDLDLTEPKSTRGRRLAGAAPRERGVGVLPAPACLPQRPRRPRNVPLRPQMRFGPSGGCRKAEMPLLMGLLAMGATGLEPVG